MSLKIKIPFEVYPDADGQPLSDGYIYVGTAGLNPEVFPISLFWDSDLTIPVAQPVRTINGFPSRSGSPGKLYTSSTSYSIIVKDSVGSLVYSDLNSEAGNLYNEWSPSYTAIYIDSDTFRIENQDVSSIFRVGTRVYLQGGADRYATVTAVSFSTHTDIDVVWCTDSSGVPATLHASMTSATAHLLRQNIFPDALAYPIQVINDITALQSINPVDTRHIQVSYHTAVGDDGGGLFRAVSGAAPGTYTDNGGTIILPSGGDGSAAWLRVYNGVLYGDWFGLNKDGSTDDTAGLQAFFDAMVALGQSGLLQHADYSVTNLTVDETYNFDLRSYGMSNNGTNMASLLYDGTAGQIMLALTGVTHGTIEGLCFKYGSAAPSAYVEIDNGTQISGSIDFHKCQIRGNGIADGSIGINIGPDSVANCSDFNWGRVECRNIQTGIQINNAQSVLHNFEYLRFSTVDTGLNMVNGGLIHVGTLNTSECEHSVVIRGGSSQVGAHQIDNFGAEYSTPSATPDVVDIASDVAGGQMLILNNYRVHPNFTGTHTAIGAATTVIAIGGRMTSGTIDVTGTQNGGDAFFKGIAGHYDVSYSTSGFGHYKTEDPFEATVGSASSFGGNVTRTGKNIGLPKVLAPLYQEEYFTMPLSRASGSTINRTIPDDAVVTRVQVIVESVGSATGTEHMQLVVGGVAIGDIEIGTAGPREFRFADRLVDANDDTSTVNQLGSAAVHTGLDTTHQVSWQLLTGSIANVRTATGKLIVYFARENVGAIGIDS